MSVPLLWSILEGDPPQSVFLRRYTLILFYMQISQLDDAGVKRELEKIGDWKFCIRNNSSIRKMRKKQEEGKAWSDLCDLKSHWGLERYTLLSAMAEGIQSQNSVLLQSLNDARRLCAALLDERLPNHDIKLSFKAFLSLDPNQPVQIPRF
ncbi:hypothetical protein M9X92_011626 [Pyricularia oryzae]|nr:hypothetical protein M9X92_011626 [Pyricularia oryzae]